MIASVRITAGEERKRGGILGPPVFTWALEAEGNHPGGGGRLCVRFEIPATTPTCPLALGETVEVTLNECGAAVAVNGQPLVEYSTAEVSLGGGFV